MKRLYLLLLTLISFSSFASTWSYQVTEDGKEGPEYKLDSRSVNFKVRGVPCYITETVIKPGLSSPVEMRTIICSIGKFNVGNNLPCFKGQQVTTVLHINDEKPANILLACYP